MKIKYRNLMVLWNIHNFLIDLAETNGMKPGRLPAKPGTEEKYIISKLNSAIKKSTAAFEAYRLNEAPWIAEELFLELSRTYIQSIRDKAALGTRAEKQMVLSVINEAMMNCLKLMSPITPFLTEMVYQNLREKFKLKKESVHLLGWPKHDEKKIDAKLESAFEVMKDIIQAGLAAREKAQLGVRWPLAEMIVVTKDKETNAAVKKLSELIKSQLNVKRVKVANAFKTTKGYEESEIKGGKLHINTKLTPELEGEGLARELMRRIQNLRKEAGLRKVDEIELVIVTDNKTAKLIEKQKLQIKEKVGAKHIEMTAGEPKKAYSRKSEEKIKESQFKIFFSKV